jgi:ribosomal subunit interface protein
MEAPLRITFRDIDQSDAIEARIRERVAKLEEYCHRITACRVVVESPHQHHHKGRLYNLRIDVVLPRGEIVVNREGRGNQAHEDVYVAIRDAFDSAERQLKNYARRRRGEVKSHEAPAHGRVVRLFREQGYGFIATPEGQEIYFHRNSVLNDGFGQLEVGNEVRYAVAEGEGENGPQASTVRLIRKHHVVE